MKNANIIVIISVLVIVIVSALIYIDIRKYNNEEKQEDNDEVINNVNGVVYGNIKLYTGNCMPGPGPSPCDLRGIQTNVYITKPVQEYKEDLLVSSVTTNKSGYFELELEPGNYSLFIYDNGSYVCTIWSCPDGVKCFCNLFTIKTGKRTELNANINHAAW